MRPRFIFHSELKFNCTIFKPWLVFLVFIPVALSAQNERNLTERLVADISDNKLDEFSHVEAAFILSDIRTEKQLEDYCQWYNNLVARIRGFRFDAINRLSSAHKIFNYIRTTLYDRYNKESTTLVDIVKTRKYNCVSATILFNLVCEEFGMTTGAFETPTHVYTVFYEFGQKVVVENTHSMGFDILQNLEVYSQYLARFYPENQVYKIGLHRLYAYENSKGRLINNTELLGLLAYNQAWFAMKNGDYERAYEMVLLAQDFNRDSRSNVDFEMRLYHKWGKQCFDEERFYDAFQVLADGVYRYPENTGLVKNTRAAFLNTLNQNWQKKNWPQSKQIIEEIIELDITDLQSVRRIQFFLRKWQRFFIQKNNNSSAEEVRQCLQKLGTG